MGHPVTKKAASSTPNWWEVSTTLDGANVAGFVESNFLTPDAAFTPPVAISSISSVHLFSKYRVTRADKALGAFPLNEPAQPTRNSTDTPATKAQQLTAIIKWLDVERKARYSPTSQYTYCNVYTYDYCYLARVYLPRVWWMSSVLDTLRRGSPVSPIYGRTVGELNANSLFNWLREYGPAFGWNRSFDLTELQNAANNGQVVIVCGQNKIPNRSGHICPIVPETATAKALRSDTTVIKPLQSQAGRINRQYMTQLWWTDGTYRDWAFWINAS
jgi:hypothetical protein